MESFLTAHGVELRLAVFLGVLVSASAVEALWPRRARRAARKSRWTLHLGLAVLGAAVGRLLVPLGALAASALAAERGLGLFGWLDVPPWASVAGSLVLLDLAVFGQHVASHRWSWFWRLHRLHHEDVDLDATSGIRFHPAELAVSILWKAAAVVLVGAPFVAVVLFEVLLSATSILSHANVALPPSVDRWLRLIIVTPDMHRVHHSVITAESRRNFGFALPCWDRLFGTYLDAPSAGHAAMELGVVDVPRSVPR